MSKGISIVIPAYNEENGIEPVLDELTKTMKSSGLLYEIIVVNDGSKDNTGKVLITRNDITLVNHPQNRGYGASLKTGISRARYELICITDADGTYPNERIPEFARITWQKNLDMLVGARVGKNVKIPLIRKPAKWFINKLANIISNVSIPDINSGLRLFKRSVAFRFFNLFPNGFSFTTTITLATLTNGYNVEYHPIDYHHRVGSSKIRPIHDTINFIMLILRLGLYFAPLRIFFPISSVVFLLAAFIGFFSKFVVGEFADDSTLLLVMTSLQIAVIGLLGELVNRRSFSLEREFYLEQDTFHEISDEDHADSRNKKI